MKPLSSEDDPVWTVKEVSQYLCVHPNTVRRWIELGILEAILLPQTGKKCIYRVKLSTLDHLFSSFGEGTA